MTTTTGFARSGWRPGCRRCFTQYPDLNIDLMLEERVAGPADGARPNVAIRMKEPSQADLVRKKADERADAAVCDPGLFSIQAGIADRGSKQIGAHRLIAQEPGRLQVASASSWSKSLLSYDRPRPAALKQLFRRSAGGPVQSRHRCAARLRDRGFPRPGPGSAENRKRRKSPGFSGPIPREIAPVQADRRVPRFRPGRDHGIFARRRRDSPEG